MWPKQDRAFATTIHGNNANIYWPSHQRLRLLANKRRLAEAEVPMQNAPTAFRQLRFHQSLELSNSRTPNRLLSCVGKGQILARLLRTVRVGQDRYQLSTCVEAMLESS